MRSTWTTTIPPEFFAAMAIGKHLERHRLTLHRDIAVHVGRRAPEKRHLDGHRPVGQVLPAVKGDHFDEFLLCVRIDFSPAQSRVDEGPDADTRNRPRFMGGNIAEHVRDDALRQIVGLDFAVYGQLLHFRRQSPVPGNHPFQQAFLSQFG